MKLEVGDHVKWCYEANGKQFSGVGVVTGFTSYGGVCVQELGGRGYVWPYHYIKCASHVPLEPEVNPMEEWSNDGPECAE